MRAHSLSNRFAADSSSTMRRVQLVNPLGSDPSCDGTIHITTSHVVFRGENDGAELWIPNALIGSVERTSSSSSSSTRLTVKCKHFLTFTLVVVREKDAADIHDALLACGRLYNINDSFAFLHKDPESKSGADDWSRLNWHAEFKRQGISDAWTATDFNSNHAYCDTYPEQLWVPTSATNQILVASAKFRSRSRLPALTYFHKASSAVICRCAQPLSGFSTRCVEDENMFDLIRSTNSSSSCLYIIDTRPRINAMANKMQGKGSEDMRWYPNAQLHTFDIENIHVMRNSQLKLVEACQKQLSVTEFLKAVDGSGWLRHLKVLYDCGKFIADSVSLGISCVVHCSDGWDRTAQAIAIAEILLDPYYRTMRGFQVLIDKDWLAFGFKFDDRCAHITAPNDEHLKEISPIFTQFIDVVYQLTRIEPLAFEFNERFLLELNESAYACLFGTFVGNCDKDRKDLRAATRTRSFWRHVDTQLASYTNPFFTPDSFNLEKLELSYSAICVWSALYNRFDTGIQPREYAADIPLSLKEHVDLMEAALMDEDAKAALQWQPLIGADACSSTTCRREFVSRYETRLHCYGCGSIFCSRCIRRTSDGNQTCSACTTAAT